MVVACNTLLATCVILYAFVIVVIYAPSLFSHIASHPLTALRGALVLALVACAQALSDCGMALQPKKMIKAAAETALAGYKRAGYAADPRNADHVEAYVFLRQTSMRVSPQAFMELLKTRVKTDGMGAKVLTQYWAVPKVNFSEGLPPTLADCLVLRDQLEEMEIIGGGSVDHAMYFVLDQQASRQSLGKMFWFFRHTFTVPSRAARKPTTG